MAGFSSYSDIVSEMALGKQMSVPFRLVTQNGSAGAAGRWYELFSAWNPSSFNNSTNRLMTTTGSAAPGAGTPVSGEELTYGWNQNTGLRMDSVSPDKIFLKSITIETVTTTVPAGVLMIVDYLFHYDLLDVTGTPVTLDNYFSLPRYTSGEGVMAVCAVENALGAATPQLTFTYTDSGNNSRTGTVTSPVNSAPIATVLMNNGGCFLPMSSGSTGIKKIDSYTIDSGGTTGNVFIALVKPIATIPILSTNIASEKDFICQYPIFAHLEEGFRVDGGTPTAFNYTACLGFLYMPGGNLAASSVITGTLDYIWG